MHEKCPGIKAVSGHSVNYVSNLGHLVQPGGFLSSACQVLAFRLGK